MVESRMIRKAINEKDNDDELKDENKDSIFQLRQLVEQQSEQIKAMGTKMETIESNRNNLASENKDLRAENCSIRKPLLFTRQKIEK